MTAPANCRSTCINADNLAILADYISNNIRRKLKKIYNCTTITDGYRGEPD